MATTQGFMPPGVAPPPSTGTEQLGHYAPSQYVHEEKPAYPVTFKETYAQSAMSWLEPVLGPMNNLFGAAAEKRRQLALPFPGTAEHLQREAKNTLLTNFFFDGGRADISKSVCLNPIFQISHAFTMGGYNERGPVPSAYNFAAIYGSDRFFLNGSVDDGKNVSIRAHTGWAPGQVTKIQGQLVNGTQGNFIQLEHDYHGLDHAANIKALNPSVTDGSGIYVANYIQSLTRNFALGLETMYQRQGADMQDAMLGYMAKYTSNERDVIATAQWQGQGMLNATYWQRLSDKVDAAADMQVVSRDGQTQALTTLGVKYDFRAATFRTMVDSNLKIASQLETRLAPTFAFTVGGEIDHPRSTARFGVGISIESASSDIPMDPAGPQPTPPNVPM